MGICLGGGIVNVQILLADDHELIREGVKLVLREYNPHCEFFEAQDYAQTLNHIRHNHRLDLILLDLAMPGMERLDGLKQVRNSAPSIPIIVLSVFEGADDVKNALAHGANGYVPKSSAATVLPSAIDLVLQGETYLPSSALSQPDIATGTQFGYKNTSPQPHFSDFDITDRQIEVLHFLVEGRTNKEIAQQLNITEPTVKTHLSKIYKILNVSNRTEAVRLALQIGIPTNN